MIPRGAAAVQQRQFACRLVRQAPNWCLQFSRMGDLVRNGAPQRSLRDRNRGKTPAHARGMTTSLTLGFPAAGGHQQPTVFSRLTELAGSWDQLAVGSGSPTHHYAWVSAYADIASTSSDLHLVVVGPPQRPVAIAPLIMRRRGGGRLEQLGVRELHEPMDLIYRSAADLTALAEARAQLGLPFWLERVPAESSTVSVVTNVWRSRGIVVCRPAPGCPWIALDRRWCESEPPLEAGRRSDLRRAQRNAEKIGPVSSQVLSPAPRELDRLLDEVFRVEAAGWKGRVGQACLAVERLLIAPLRRFVWSAWGPIAERAARAYVAGPELADALRVCRALAGRGDAATICWWDGDGEPPRRVADAYLAALRGLAAGSLNCYLSIKAPSLGFSHELLGELVETARPSGVGLHFDSLAPEGADRTWASIRAAAGRGASAGCTLPARWRRSLSDADHAVALGIRVRVVKGQWADPEAPDRDVRSNFLAVVESLAGRAGRVGIATHDPELARAALARLCAAGTPCELELLYGLPARTPVAIARAGGVPVRFYVPYGHAWLPYGLSQARQHPRVLWWAMRDLLAGSRGTGQP